jgi:hypothetical protein
MRKIIICLFLFSTQIFSGIGAGTSAPGALPVELTLFTANFRGSNVELRWATVTEVNNFGFEIERASALTSLIQDWEKVGFVQGNGNSNSPKEYSFTDIPNGGTKFIYRLKQIDNDGNYKYSSVVSIEIKVLNEYTLNQNYPNPFNPSTVITYSIPISSKVTLTVYDVLGKLITTLVNEKQESGSYSVNFNASGLSNGMYFYKMQSDNFVKTNKMLLLK